MTKREALQKIEELKQFVVDLESKEQLGHGDLIRPIFTTEERIVIKKPRLLQHDLKYDYLLVDRFGVVVNSFTNMSDMETKYTKIRNIFDGK